MSGIGLGLKGAALAARLVGVKASFAKVPRWVWIGLAITAAVVGAVIWHQSAAHKALNAADEAGYARAVQVYERALQIVHGPRGQATAAGRSRRPRHFHQAERNPRCASAPHCC
jgi:homospermidine synthase